MYTIKHIKHLIQEYYLIYLFSLVFCYKKKKIQYVNIYDNNL